MPKSNNKRAAAVSFWSMRLLTIGSRIAAFFATRIFRIFIIIVFVLVGLYISYRQVWQPILATAPLPPGVTEKSPQLNAELLKTINAQRIERVEAPRIQFNIEALFKPATTAS